MNLPWIEKYRPDCFSKIVSHKNVVDILQKYVKMKTIPNLILYGVSGTGKTSLIKSCANEMFGKYSQMMTLEINASEERGIDVIRTRINPFANGKSVSMWNDS